MRVFITGAAGFIGSATVHELIKNGHQVLALARSAANIETLTDLGAEPHKGDLKDIASLKRGAEVTDAVIHLAFIHDFADFAASCATDRAAIEAFGQALSGTGKPLIIASGTLGLPAGTLGTETDEPERNTPPFSERALSSDLVYALSKEKDIRGAVIRFAPTVHGKGDGAFMAMLIEAYRRSGSAVYVGDGSARWSAVHREDAAELLRLAVEKGTAGATYHAVAEQGVRMKEIVEVMGKKLQLPVKSASGPEVAGTLGFLGHAIGVDNPVSSERTRRELGWHPTRLGLLADLEANYFS